MRRKRNKISNQSSPTMMAKAVLEIADEIERAETAIKKELLNAAKDNDLNRIKTIVSRWISEPVSNVLVDDTRIKSGKSRN